MKSLESLMYNAFGVFALIFGALDGKDIRIVIGALFLILGELVYQRKDKP